MTDAQHPTPGRRRHRLWWLLAFFSPSILLAIPFLRHGAGATDAPAVTPLVGQSAPSIQGRSADGHQFDLASHRGRWVLVNFFATWCSGCRKEQPQLDALAAEHRNGDLDIVSVVHEDLIANANRYLADHHATWPVVDDRGSGIADDYLLQGLPESFVIDPNGRVAAALLGSIHSGEVDAIMTQPLPSPPP